MQSVRACHSFVQQCRLETGALKSAQGATLDAANITWREVGYVPVRVPSHYEGPTGEFPDPLMPRENTDLPGGMSTPLLLTVCSGMAYRLLKDWGGLGRDQVHWLMVLHEGEWLGHAGEPIYVLLNGLGLLWMLVSGALMLSQRWRRRAPAKTPAP